MLASLRFSNIRKLNQTKHVESKLEHMQHTGSIPVESTLKTKEPKNKAPFSYASNSGSSQSESFSSSSSSFISFSNLWAISSGDFLLNLKFV